MSDDITPALTAEEWDHVRNGYPWLREAGAVWGTEAERAAQFASDAAQEGKPHRTAALALHGQEFGFTREDVDLLEAAAMHFQRPVYGVSRERLQSLSERIGALLPPDTRQPITGADVDKPVDKG